LVEETNKRVKIQMMWAYICANKGKLVKKNPGQEKRAIMISRCFL
jgi:hypothetical protein